MHVYAMHIECAKGAFQLDRKKGLIYRYTRDHCSLNAFAACMLGAGLSIQKKMSSVHYHDPNLECTDIEILIIYDKYADHYFHVIADN